MDEGEAWTEALTAGAALQRPTPAAASSSSAARVAVLHERLVNELCAPDVLRYDTRLMERMRRACAEQTAVLERGGMGELEAGILQLDLDRVKYTMSALIRTRARKLQRYAFHLLERRHDEYDDALSSEEWRFVGAYAAVKERHMRDTVLSRLPRDEEGAHADEDTVGFSSITTQDDTSITRKPKRRNFVVCQVNADLGEVATVRGDAPQLLFRGNIRTAQFDLVRSFVEEGRMRLL